MTNLAQPSEAALDLSRPSKGPPTRVFFSAVLKRVHSLVLFILQRCVVMLPPALPCTQEWCVDICLDAFPHAPSWYLMTVYGMEVLPS